MNPYIEQKIQEFNVNFKVVTNQFRELIFIMKRRDDVIKLDAEELLHKQELWLRENLEDVWKEAIKTSSKASEKCVVEIPTYDEDGVTQKDSDYWVLCLKDRPCPIHDQRKMYELGRKVHTRKK